MKHWGPFDVLGAQALRPEDVDAEEGLFFNTVLLAQNARALQRDLRRHRIQFCPVLKGGYLCDPVIDALGRAQLSTVAVSGSAPPLCARGFQVIRKLYPSGRADAASQDRFTTRAEASANVIEQLLRQHPYDETNPLKLFIPVMTSEKREGLPFEEVLPFASGLKEHFGRAVKVAGLQGNYGCINRLQPEPKELRRLVELANHIKAGVAESDAFTLSLGGSIFLSALHKLAKIDGLSLELRVAEALFAGTLPGGAPYDQVKPTGKYRASVLQYRDGSTLARKEIVVNVGSAILGSELSDVPIPGAKLVAIGSEIAVLSVPHSAVHKLPSKLDFTLNYGQLARALAERSSAGSYGIFWVS